MFDKVLDTPLHNAREQQRPTSRNFWTLRNNFFARNKPHYPEGKAIPNLGVLILTILFKLIFQYILKTRTYIYILCCLQQDNSNVTHLTLKSHVWVNSAIGSWVTQPWTKSAFSWKMFTVYQTNSVDIYFN